MTEGLKQRTGAHILGTPTTSTSDSSSTSGGNKTLLDLNPDYVLKVLYPKDKNSDAVDLEAVTNMKIILKLLYSGDFTVEVRPDTNDQYVLLFVTLRESCFERLIKLANTTDELFNVKVNAPSDEKVSVAERLRLINLKLTLPERDGGCGLKVGEHGIQDIIPVKSLQRLESEYKSNWGALGKVFKKAARDEDVKFLKENLGTGYALYYKFVQAYISSVGCLGLIGILTWYFLGQFSLIYAVANIFVGCTTYLCIYAGEAKSSKEWNLKNIDNSQLVKVADENIDPQWKVLLRQVMFVPVIISGGLLLFSAQFACFLLEIFLTEIYEGPFKGLLAIVPTVCVCVIVPVCTLIYSGVASKYLGFENNSTYQAEKRSLMKKLFAFDFLASYAALSITAFIYLPLGYLADPYLQTIHAIFTQANSVYTYIPYIATKKSDYKVNSLRLSNQTFYFMVTNQIIGFILEHALPQVLAVIFNLSRISSLLGSPASIKQLDFEKLDDPAEHEYLQLVRSKFKCPASSLDADYKQHVVQYGFLMMFGPVWSLGAIISFIFGVLQQEADYLKYIKFCKPPTPVRAESSAPWVGFMRILLIVGSFISIAITLMYGSTSIESYVGKTSVSGQWYHVFPAAILSAVTVHATIYLLEKVIDGFYDDSQIEYLEREKKVSGFLKKFNEKRVAHNDDYNEELNKVNELVAVIRK